MISAFEYNIWFEAFIIKGNSSYYFCAKTSLRLLRFCHYRGRVNSTKKKERKTEKKNEEKHVDFFSSCQEKKRRIEERKNKEEVYSVLIFCLILYSPFFSHLQARRCVAIVINDIAVTLR